MEEKETRRLSVRLNDEETRAKTLELVDHLMKLDELTMFPRLAKAALKAVQKSMKDDIEKLEKKISLLTQTVKSGKEDREVECVERRNEIQMTIETYRTDSGEMVATRPMTQNERQRAVEGRVDPEMTDEQAQNDANQEAVVNGEPLPGEDNIVEPDPQLIENAPESQPETVEAEVAKPRKRRKSTHEQGAAEETPA